MRLYTAAPTATDARARAAVAAAAAHCPSDARPAARVDVAMEGILPTVAMARILHQRHEDRPATYVRASFGVPGIRNTTSMRSSNLRDSLIQESLPSCCSEKKALATLAPMDFVSARTASGLATLMWTVPGGAQETGGPYMRDPRHPRHFTDEFKRQIVDLYNAGKPKREIMDEYDLGKSTVERWIKSINATGSPRAADNRTPEQNRILELERENRRLRMEVDVLKQAAPICARK